MHGNLSRGKQAMARDPGHSGAAAASPTLHPLARTVVHAIAIGFGRDEASQRAGYAAAQRGARFMSECPEGHDKLSWYLGVLAFRRHTGGRS